MPEVSIQRYSPEHTTEWNNFVAKAKNGTFLFDRSYMDYHSDRFKDHSLLIRIGGSLSGLLVANEREMVIESHGGLTYGGLILKRDVRLPDVTRMFEAFVGYYRLAGFKRIKYKCVPSYIHSFPANEDQFALFALGASLVRRDTSSVIVNEQRLPYMHGRSQSIEEARERNFAITQHSSSTRFWTDVLVPTLRERHEAEPTHSSKEMDLLMSRLSDSIQLYEISDPELMAGAVVYVHPNCVHTQYLSSTARGRKEGALDFLIDHLIGKFSGKKYFSFGTSNNEGGPQLNAGLVQWKEGFGARTFVHDFYEIDLK